MNDFYTKFSTFQTQLYYGEVDDVVATFGSLTNQPDGTLIFVIADSKIYECTSNVWSAVTDSMAISDSKFINLNDNSLNIYNSDTSSWDIFIGGASGGRVDTVISKNAGIVVDSTDPVNPEVGTVISADTGNGLSLKSDGLYTSEQIQADWTQTTTTDPDYIKNKPTIPTVNDNIITVHQDGVVTDQTFTLNQNTDKTINLINTDNIIVVADAAALPSTGVSANVIYLTLDNNNIFNTQDGGTNWDEVSKQLQGDWSQSTNTEPDYIKNKPDYLPGSSPGTNGNYVLEKNGSTYSWIENTISGSKYLGSVATDTDVPATHADLIALWPTANDGDYFIIQSDANEGGATSYNSITDTGTAATDPVVTALMYIIPGDALPDEKYVRELEVTPGTISGGLTDEVTITKIRKNLKTNAESTHTTKLIKGTNITLGIGGTTTNPEVTINSLNIDNIIPIADDSELPTTANSNLLYITEDEHKIWQYDGTTWVQPGGGSGGLSNLIINEYRQVTAGVENLYIDCLASLADYTGVKVYDRDNNNLITGSWTTTGVTNQYKFTPDNNLPENWEISINTYISTTTGPGPTDIQNTDGSIDVGGSGYSRTVDVFISADADNQIELKSDGLYGNNTSAAYLSSITSIFGS